MTETADHDQGQPPLYCGPAGALVIVLLDGQRWAALPPGDPLADRLAADAIHNKNPPRRPTTAGLDSFR